MGKWRIASEVERAENSPFFVGITDAGGVVYRDQFFAYAVGPNVPEAHRRARVLCDALNGLSATPSDTGRIVDAGNAMSGCRGDCWDGPCPWSPRCAS